MPTEIKFTHPWAPIEFVWHDPDPDPKPDYLLLRRLYGFGNHISALDRRRAQFRYFRVREFMLELYDVGYLSKADDELLHRIHAGTGGLAACTKFSQSAPLDGGSIDKRVIQPALRFLSLYKKRGHRRRKRTEQNTSEVIQYVD